MIIIIVIQRVTVITRIHDNDIHKATHAYIYIYTHIYIYMHTCVYIYIYIYAKQMLNVFIFV